MVSPFARGAKPGCGDLGGRDKDYHRAGDGRLRVR